MLSYGYVQGVETDAIRGYARLPVFQEYDCLRERLAAFRVADVSGQDDRPLLRMPAEGKQRQNDGHEDASEGNHFSVNALAADWPAR